MIVCIQKKQGQTVHRSEVINNLGQIEKKASDRIIYQHIKGEQKGTCKRYASKRYAKNFVNTLFQTFIDE